ncbi:rod shape-determining protein MreC [Lachnospiraceae bacterium ZAX-1]
MKRKSKFIIPSKYILIGLTFFCILVMFISFTMNLTGGPLNTVAGYVFMPMQKGINSVGIWLTDRTDSLKALGVVMEENKQLQAQVDMLTTEINTLKLQQYELDHLKELIALDEKYPDYDKVAAQIFSHDGGNWFNTFLINKGTNDGIEIDMIVMAGSGLVGIIYDVGPNYAKVRSIIDDASNVSGITLSTSDRCIVSGNLKTMNEDQVIQFTNLKCKDGAITTGEQVVTSYISDKYLPGLLIGYVQSIEKDSNNLTHSGTITTAVDFEHLQDVLIILEKKESVEE